HSIRHYTCVRISDWKGELVLSVFLRLTKTGSTFFTEANYFLLTPVAEQYRKVDSMRPSLGIKGTLKMFGVAMVKGLLLWYFSVLILLFKVALFLSLERKTKPTTLGRGGSKFRLRRVWDLTPLRKLLPIPALL